MFLLVFLSKSKIFTRVTLVLHLCPRVSLLSLASGTRFEFRLTLENEFFIFRKYYRKIVLLVTKMRLLPSFNQTTLSPFLIAPAVIIFTINSPYCQ